MASNEFHRRRSLICSVGAVALYGVAKPKSLLANSPQPNRTLKILRWKHFIPAVEQWFNEEFVPEWGSRNSVDVSVSSVGLSEINTIANAEAAAGGGHDLVEFVESRADLEDQFIDHRDLFEQCQSAYGDSLPQARRSCYNPRTKRFFGLSTHYSPAILSFRQDLWDSIGRSPDDWDAIRSGGRAIKLLHDIEQGISLSNGHNGEHGLSAVMAAFGSYVQDADGNPTLTSSNTLDVLKFVKSMYQESMSPDVLKWSPPSNNHFMLSGQGSLTIDTLSIARTAENKQFPVNENLTITAVPTNEPNGRTPAYGANTWGIWQFSKNSEAAKQFLFDYVAASQAVFVKSGFQEMPSFPGSIENRASLVTKDAFDSKRYAFLIDMPDKVANYGYPGFSNAAVGEVRSRHIIPSMFRHVVKGELSAEEAMSQASKEIESVFAKWRSAGKI